MGQVLPGAYVCIKQIFGNENWDAKGLIQLISKSKGHQIRLSPKLTVLSRLNRENLGGETRQDGSTINQRCSQQLIISENWRKPF